MILPSKLIPKEKSLIYKGLSLLLSIENENNLNDLYDGNKYLFIDIGDFIQTLSVLYILGYIDVKEGAIIKL